MPCLLVVEDNPADVLLVRTALAELDSEVQVHSVGNGEEALDFVGRKGRHANAPNCDLILLDLNMPGLDGHAFLERLRTDERLRYLPVAVWSSSRDRTDILRAYREGANAYYRKRNDYTETVGLMQVITEHWFHAAQLPTAAARP
jgi:two-component system response regulator